MVVAVEALQQVKGMSLEEFLNYDDGTDTVYQLEDGELVVMPPESDRNQRIESFLFAYFLQIGILPHYLRMKTEVVVSGLRPTVRVPDLLVLSEEGAQSLQGASRSTISLEMPPPQLVVEVVSPGKENANRDYRYKLSQYQSRGISEYWIVDPMEERITVFVLVEGLYESREFSGEEVLESPFLQGLSGDRNLSAVQILRGGVNS
ncbi:MAG: Uma2 family endonuclease [Roseofilum sp. SBFL]|uniref:Uma2 family endonuclease n=1 Tax=unclassified Roseofilum TaxID=2620099 RepID=UPI001B027C0D|nr:MULTISPECIES: Uma2 family endonuclease [unclassified Roseofilum]MBP0013142.1 Uma2 family endonuclease [Roseofilum sp. SID3]MBP0026452.1 Uma2 family endonuclease [Roseofilum sp. SID2]MBP0037830.1 Uma2 family endonuclease [Roseofilum sp. SID1]MBP0043187.1 Uma2 family endonuclease [Roseofilum sp. SBFL]